nr:DnaJ domain-containing protein [Microvirga makkahensis]
MNGFAHANTARLAKTIRIVGGILILGAAVLLGLRGRIDMALLLGSVGAWLLGWGSFRLPGLGGHSQPTSGGTSRVRSASIEMELDHDTGDMNGTVLAGTFAGQGLSTLDLAQLQHLLRECGSDDPDGVRLLEAYLDRRFPDWRTRTREDEQTQAGPRPSSGTMTEEEACQILDIRPGADAEEIRQAYRNLMKKLHPDQGGSAYLAARVNQAKDVLLKRQH